MIHRYDAIIIGGGHNGLVTAALLATAGRSVLVIEQRDVVGGAAATEPVWPGFKVNTGASDAGLFRPEVAAALELDRYGLEFIDSPVTACALQPDGAALTLWRDVEKSQAEIARFSERDAARFPAFIEAVGYAVDFLEGLLLRTPPDLAGEDSAAFLAWFQAGLGMERVGRRELGDFFRILALSAAEFLDEWFESEALKGALGAAGVAGTRQGPLAPYTAWVLLYHYLGGRATGFRASRFVKGGTGRLAQAVAQAAQAHGATIQMGRQVVRVLIEQGRATGVVLDSGETISAEVVVSNAGPGRTFFELVGAQHLDVKFGRRLRNIRYRGCTARVNLALSDLPQFTGIEPQLPVTNHQLAPLSGHILVSPSLEYLERAYDDAKYGRFSQKPYLDVVIPTVLDPSLAPAGRHVMSITMQYAPYRLRAGDWETQRDRLGDHIVETLAGYAPRLKELILGRQVITPLDWERDYGLTEGSIYHGQLAFDQWLFMRPAGGCGQYRTPIKRLYLCGAGTHPGGGVTGAPGYNAAREVLKDLES